MSSPLPSPTILGRLASAGRRFVRSESGPAGPRPRGAGRLCRASLTVLALATAPASAQGPLSVEPYGPLDRGSDLFAGDFVHGSYIGAPLTRFPRPTRIVPAPWSYGTYGIPTVSGIAAAPVAPPTLTVINAGGRAARGRTGAGDGFGTAGAQVIAVEVPRR